MSAATVHADVERKMRSKKNVYDFGDFVGCVESSKSQIVRMNHTNIYHLLSLQSQSKLRKLPNLTSHRVIQFSHGSLKLFVKELYSTAESLEMDFLQVGAKMPFTPQPLRKQDRGITQDKKDDIVSKLVPIMPPTRARFWNDIAVAEGAADLLNDNYVE